MEILVASAIGLMTASGVYLVLRLRAWPVILGLTMLTYAVNVFLFTSGRLVVDMPAILSADAGGYADPLPQALVLTAIVISFGMTAVAVMMALGAFLEAGDDRVEMTDQEDRK
ncbi:multisubunit potassium/proton antiporter, PhaC subunit [Gemmobacter megaterium]|uniref:Multisubunit potassium/proton antiporter, PhaC subunit n=1 Tax=Gemmobacter megaterium TaxID=1086013 RepID=A0A1N7PDC2_9RHOB|nr:Na+/H+ antiporter subunit C [Gemmobacter megaterium]GGE18964.1 Na+/H+ antiporter subunit C [Gemmobacter megaterium]SIT08591.1 multisubunit potassium/proton antiporter, PhaC subunit [Gemmobacter megaterium]